MYQENFPLAKSYFDLFCEKHSDLLDAKSLHTIFNKIVFSLKDVILPADSLKLTLIIYSFYFVSLFILIKHKHPNAILSIRVLLSLYRTSKKIRFILYLLFPSFVNKTLFFELLHH